MRPAARRAVTVAALVLLGAAGCGKDEPPQAPRESSAGPVCDVGIPPPPGFLPVGDDRVPEAGHVGVRQTFRDPGGRRIEVTAGISGEIGEGAPLVATLEVSGGWEGRVLGRGTDWVLVWDADRPCTQHSIGGAGFGRGRFLRLLEEWGVAGPASV